MGLTVALDDDLLAEGQLYWDDGVRISKSRASSLPKTLFFFCCENDWVLPSEAPSLGTFKAQIQADKTKPKGVNWGEMEQTLGMSEEEQREGMDLAKAIFGGHI